MESRSSFRDCLGRQQAKNKASNSHGSPRPNQQSAAALNTSRRAKSSPNRHNGGANQKKSKHDYRHDHDHYRANSTISVQQQQQQQQPINYWHYKQTGIRSRPIKLLQHPIEHIERKIIITYLLGFMFKFMAILTGPIIVLIFYLITLPFNIIRRLVWSMLNLSFLCDARIRTSSPSSLYSEILDDSRQNFNSPKPSSSSSTTTTPATTTTRQHVPSTFVDDATTAGAKNNSHHYHQNRSQSSTKRRKRPEEEEKVEEKERKQDKQIYWNYCPLNFIETYWFKEKSINTVIVVIEDDKRKFSIDKLRQHLRINVFVKPEYRKFLSNVVAKGIPYYKSYYWHYLGLIEDVEGEEDDEDDDDEQAEKQDQENESLSAVVVVAPDKLQQSTKRDNNSSSTEKNQILSANNDNKKRISHIDDYDDDANRNFRFKKGYDQFSVTSSGDSGSYQSNLSQSSSHSSDIDSSRIKQNPSQSVFVDLPILQEDETNNSVRGVNLRQHVFMDQLSIESSSSSLSGKQQKEKNKKKEINLATIRNYAWKLFDINLDFRRPLWELRAIKSPSASTFNEHGESRVYLIFRCHQSLADGKSLSKMLTEQLTVQPSILTAAGNNNPKIHLQESLSNSNDDNDNDSAREQTQNVVNSGAPPYSSQVAGEENQFQNDNDYLEQSKAADSELKLLKEKESFVGRISESNSRLSAIFVGPLTVLLWIIWSFTRRKNNHLNECLSDHHHFAGLSDEGTHNQHHDETVIVDGKTLVQNRDVKNTSKSKSGDESGSGSKNRGQVSRSDPRRFYMTQYDLTKFHQIKQMTRSTVSDVILCALSGALRDYLRKFNAVSNPPNLNISLTVDMRQPNKKQQQQQLKLKQREMHKQMQKGKQEAEVAASSQITSTTKCNHQSSFNSTSTSTVSGSGSGSGSGTSKPVDHHQAENAQHYKSECNNNNNNINDINNMNTTIPEVNCTLVNVPIPTSVEGTIPRLWDIRGTMEELRTSADPWVMLGLQRLLFDVLPTTWYRNIINYIALGNSSTFVSNIQGPQNMVESWCVDLFQRALIEARQAPKIYMVSSDNGNDQDQEQTQERHDGLSSILLEPKQDQSSSNFGEDFNQNQNDPSSNEPLMKSANSSAADKQYRQHDAMAARQHLHLDDHHLDCHLDRHHRGNHKMAGQLELIHEMGNISAIYYCMQPPTSNTPISFNCITYHNKLFITSLSRSLLVEDSKLLIRLFFRQLDQLADTIARRRSLVTIIQSPSHVCPIEIQPSSPIDPMMMSASLDAMYEHSGSEHDNYNYNRDHDDEQRSVSASSIGSRLRQSSGIQLFKDDLETDIGSNTIKCANCLRKICVCQRRKSLFSLDSGKERAANLISLLRPVYSRSRSQRSLSPHSETASPNDMRSLEELREEDATYTATGAVDDHDHDELIDDNNYADTNKNKELQISEAIKSPAAAAASSWNQRSRRPKRSTLSLDFSAKDTRTLHDCASANGSGACSRGDSDNSKKNDDIPQQQKQQQQLRQSDGNFPIRSNHGSDQNIENLKNSDQLFVPGRSPMNGNSRNERISSNSNIITKHIHSRSETDLPPSVCGLEPRDDKSDEGSPSRQRRGSTVSWLTFVKRQPGKHSSRLSKSSATSNAHQLDNNNNNSTTNRRSSSRYSFANLPDLVFLKERRSMFEAPIGLLLNRRFGGSDFSWAAVAKRRQSAAAGGAQIMQQQQQQPRSAIMMKDEMNADISLRYQHQLRTNIRSRRFSTIVGSSSNSGQRRASLIPFGLIQNNSLPRMFWEDPEETHV